jgi:hypothetical protein
MSAGVARDITLLCELYVNEGKNGDLYPLLTAKASQKDKLRLYVHDIMDSDEPLTDRKECLVQWGFQQRLVVVESLETAKAELKRVNDMGYEGIVLKNFNDKFQGGPCPMAKMKYKDITSYQVAQIDPTLERMDVFVVSSALSATNGQRTKLCGVKLCNKYKSQVKVGDWVDIEHQGVLANGGLRHPNYKGLTKGATNAKTDSNRPTDDRRKVSFAGQAV